MLKKSTTKLAALFVALCLALTLAPFAAFAEEPTESPTETTSDATTETSEPTEESGEEDASEPTATATEATTEETSEASTVETDPPEIATPTNAVTITVAEGESGETALYIPEGEPVTGEALLAGVSAADENGDPVPVTVADTGGLDLASPQPNGEPGSPEPYLITYAAEGAEAVTRECFVTVGIVPLANSGDCAGLWSMANAGGTYEMTDDIFIDTEDGVASTNAGLVVAENLTIDLKGFNLTITVPSHNGIKILGGKTLTIMDSTGNNGELNVRTSYGSQSANYGAGINTSDGSLVIKSGRVTAQGAYGGAGIGSGYGNGSGTITISGGIVDAKGGQYGAGIGSGLIGAYRPGDSITISGGDVTAEGGSGGAGIGGGFGSGVKGITISGGTVNARGGTGGLTSGAGANIGGGGGTGASQNGSAYYSININSQPTSPTVTAGSISGILSVGASIDLPDSISQTKYQWYSNTANDTNGTLIDGATSASFAIPTDLTAGTYYYYCVISSRYTGNATSSVAAVTVAAPNTPPALKGGVPASTTATVTVDAAYTLDLSTIFADADGDPLIYTVVIDGGTADAADESYSYIRASIGTVTLVFEANDGEADSTDTYTVTLTVNAAPTCTISATPSPLAFDSLQSPYTQPAAKTVTITNTGTGSVTLNQPTSAANYDIVAYPPNTTLAATNDAATFTVQPKAGLAVGMYNETISITGNNSTGASVSVTFEVTNAPPVTYAITYDNGGGSGTMANGTATDGVPFTLPACAFTPPASKEFKAWEIGGAEYAVGAEYTFTGNASVTAVWQDKAVTPPPPPPVKPEPKPEQTRPAPRPNYDRDDDNDDDPSYTPPRLPAPTHTLRKGDGYYDTMLGRLVQLRLYADLPVLGYTSGAAVDKIRGLFEKWFTNPVHAIHFERAERWEQPVKVAARLDLAGMDTKRLVIYYYDPKSGVYRKLAAPAYWIDANGFLHFTTEYAGEIVISEGELEKR